VEWARKRCSSRWPWQTGIPADGDCWQAPCFFITVTSFALACYITINTNVICSGGWYKGTINEDVFVLAVLKLASMKILCFHTGGIKIPPVEIGFLLSVRTSCVLVGFLHRGPSTLPKLANVVVPSRKDQENWPNWLKLT